MGFIIQLSIETTSGLRRKVFSKQRVKGDFNPGTTQCSQTTVETSTIQRLSFPHQSVTRQIPTTKGDTIKKISTLVIQAMETTACIKLPISSTAVLGILIAEVIPTFNQWPATPHGSELLFNYRWYQSRSFTKTSTQRLMRFWTVEVVKHRSHKTLLMLFELQSPKI